MARLARYGFQTLCGLLLIAGTLAFSAGGRSHPPVDESLGELGSVAFYRGFAEEVARHDDWVGIHALLLFGPILWGLGLVALTLARWQAGERQWSSLGLFASTIGVTFWAVAFILDGFVTPSLAETLLASDAALAPAYWADFALVQNVVIRAGLVSWLLLGIGMAAFGVSLLSARRRVAFSRLLAVSGLALGLWPLVAWAQGTFEPGPFTSPLWNTTALLTSVWFLMTGIWVLTAPGADGSAGVRTGPLRTTEPRPT